ncbi:MAG: ribonuclease H-like domain-containing protein [Pseudomonadota bacterium]
MRRLSSIGRPASCASEPVTTEAELAERLGAQMMAPGVLHVERCYPFPLAFGHGSVDRSVLRHLAAVSGGPVAPPPRLVVLDTETTGLAGGTGTLPFLIGALVCDSRGATLHQWFLTRFEGEEPMLAALLACVCPDDWLLTYNGKSFDVPLVQTRMLLKRLHSGLDRLHHVDLLGLVRKAFNGRWDNCRLQTAERKLLGFTRQDDIPGEQIPSVWFDWMRYGRATSIAPVLEHNRQDLVGLAALVERLHHVFVEPESFGARLISTFAHMGCDELTRLERLLAARPRLDVAEAYELARLARRAGRWDIATSQWEWLVTLEHVDALEHLAKYHEHQQRDFRTALEFTDRLIARTGPDRGHLHRRERLLHKLTAAGKSDVAGQS